MQVRFRCGTVQPVNPDRTPSPVCGHCGSRDVAGVVDAPPPRFTGHVTGPYAETKALGAIAVNLAEKPLSLKSEEPPTPKERTH